MRNQKRFLSAGLLVALPLMASQAIAAPIPFTDWSIDLTGLNTTTVGATTYGGLGAIDTLNDITVAGQSTVIQNLGSTGSLGESFSESGYLNWIGAKVFPTNASLSPAAFGAFLGTNDAAGNGFNGIYFEWIDLTGVVTSAAGDISFDTGVAQTGSLSLYLDLDGMNLGLVGTGVGERLELASYDILPISGGSDIGIDGGAFPSGTVGLTLAFASIHSDVIFRDSSDNILDTGDLFQFIDVDATIADPALFCTGANGTGDCNANVNPATALSFIASPIQHEGSTVIAHVPEPSALMLLAGSLVSLGGAANRKRKSKSI